MGAVLTSDERALFERWSVFARELSGDHALLDRQTRCAAVFGRELLKVGDSLAEHAADPLIYPLKDACNVRVMFRGECWCAHVQPIRNEAGDAALNLCSFTDTQQALDAAAKTDALMKLMPLYSAIEQNFAGLWNSAREIEKRFERENDFSALEEVFSLKAALSHIGSASANVYEYGEMLSKAPSVRRLDAAEFCAMLVERCNAALAKCGRRIEFVAAPVTAPICVDASHAMYALVNALQNALLYSPRESVPVLAVICRRTGAREYVDIRVSNETALFTEKDFRTIENVEFSYQRAGFGLALIERFAKECGGRLERTEEDGRYVLTLTFAAVHDGSRDTVRFEASQAHYDTGVPDILELKMGEVAAAFGQA